MAGRRRLDPVTLQERSRRAVVARVRRAGVGSRAVAEILALVAAFFFALAATLQQKGALGMGEVSLGSPKSLLELASQKWWLAGTVALLCGYAFQAVALANGRLAVIQPLLVTTIVFALPLGYFLTSQDVNRREIGGAAVVVARARRLHGRRETRPTATTTRPRDEWAIALARVRRRRCVLLVLGGQGLPVRKAGLYGACAGVLYGLSASMCKPTVGPSATTGSARCSTSWESYAFAVAGILAFVVQQISLATGHLASSVATVSVCNPLVSIVIGTSLLDERLAEPDWHKLVAYAVSASRCSARS